MNPREPKVWWSSTIFPYRCKRSKDEGSVLFRRHTAGGAMKLVKRCPMTVLCPREKNSIPLKLRSIDSANTVSTAPKEVLCIPFHGIQLPILPQITSWWSCQLDLNTIRQRGHFRPRDCESGRGQRPISGTAGIGFPAERLQWSCR